MGSSPPQGQKKCFAGCALIFCDSRPLIHRVPQSRHPLQNIAWLVGERVVRGAVTATVLGIVARHLEPAGFGRLNFAIAAVTIAAALANLGLEGVVVSELIRQPARAGAVLGTAFRLRLAAGAATLGLLALPTRALMPDDAFLITVVALSLIIQPVEVVDLWFQRHLQSRRTVMARFVGLMAGATLKLCLVAANARLPAFAWAQVADVGFVALALGWAGRRAPDQSGPWAWDPEIARTLWKRGAPLAVSGLMVAFTMRLDQLLVRTWLGDREAGIYFAATRLTDLAQFAGYAMMLSLFPALATVHAHSPQKYQSKLQTLFDVMSALGWLVALGATVLGAGIIRLLYGQPYAGAAPVLIVQSWACLVSLSATVRWHFILLSAPVTLNLAAALMHTSTLVAMSTWLMPRLGPTGAALALLTANLVSGYLSTFLFPPLRGCVTAQTRGLLIPFAPTRWRSLIALLRDHPEGSVASS
jgi:O-antigen/teichoic acid export membrane protein